MQLPRRPRAMTLLGIVTSAVLCTTAAGQNLVEGPPAKAIVKNIDLVESTLDYPTGDYAPVDIRTGRSINMNAKPQVVWQDTLRVDGIAWIRLYFNNAQLDDGSFIRVTSLHDGEVQELDAETLAMWDNASAYFNGNAVRIELVAGPFTTGNEFSINQFAFENGQADRGEGNCGICGADDRTPSSDNNFARLMPVGCSATLYNAESCMVTAGHCLGGGGPSVHFNVPDSNSDGSTNNPPVADQFPVLAESGVNGGVGADYGAMRIGTNSAGETPVERYGSFIPLASSIPNSGTLTVNGYGVDNGQPNRSQTQQFHDGPVLSVNSSSIEYDIDVTFGNSGSSLIYNGEIVGVVTHCSGGCVNYGNRIDTAGFIQARAIACEGDTPPPGECPVGEIEDCFGNCCPANWVGDGYCDDGSYDYNGVAIYLNCDEFDCDGGDCPPESCGDGGGDPTGACCIGNNCSIETAGDCASAGGDYQGDDTSCAGNPCGGGGGGEGDTCNDAVDAFEGSNAFDTTGNTDSGYGEPDDSQCDGTYLDWAGSPDHWFRFVAPGDGTANFTTCDAGSFDTSMVLYSGDSCNALSQVACNGDSAGGDGNCQQYYSEIAGFPVTGGQTYYIRLGGWQGATGSGTLTISGDFGAPVEGACCYTDGSCEIQPSQSACAGTGGTWQGAGSDCSIDCGSGGGGACCIGSSCDIQPDEGACTGQGGTWLGEGSTCSGNPCGGGGGGESFLEIAGIDSYDGYQSGVNVIQTMTIPAGSNILGVGWEDATLSAFDPSWGSEAGIMFTWENDGQPFSGYIAIFDGEDAPGDYGPVTGYDDLTQDWNFSDADGEVQVEFFETYDDAAGVVDGTWTGGRIYIVHDGDAGDPTGACCLGDSCSIQTAADCSTSGGDYLGDGTSCGNNPCVDPTGACCLESTCSVTSAADCEAAGGDYLGDGTNCDNDPCVDPPATGACCIGSSCNEGTAEACSNLGGTYQGDGSSCNAVECGGSDEIQVLHAISGTNLAQGVGDNFTVDLYVTLPEGARVDAVAGTPEQAKMLTCSGDFFQSEFGGPRSTDVNPDFYEFDPNLEHDSRITIGAIDSSGNPFDNNALQDIGISWDNFEAGGDLSVGNGLWFVLPTDEQGEARLFTAQDCSQHYGVLLARVTALGLDSEVGFEGLIQGRTADDVILQETTSLYAGYSDTQDCNGNRVSDACDIANGTSEDANGNGIPDECDNPCLGDADGDGDSDVDDILEVLGNFGSNSGGGDVDGDGDCDVDDILQVISYYGTC
ncbi:MAG: hypothetical protein MK089_06205 [Phycisphaerales bacterium]|nr:hypothetical protein [Phycisphaerales bacterium]